MSSTSISLITPTLNAAEYLPECLRSVQDQQYSALEHIFVDGGSADATGRIVDEARSGQWLSRPGLKQSAAINLGFRIARGEIVSWLNADDLLADGALDVVHRHFSQCADLDVLIGDCVVIDAAGRRLWSIRPGPYDFRRLLTRGNYIGQPAAFFRRRVLDRVGYLDETLDYGMDYDLWLRLRPLKVVYVPVVLAVFRWHATSKTATNLRANWRELLRIVRRYGGGWTRELAWSYFRAHLTLGRDRLEARLRAYRAPLFGRV